MNKIYLVKNGDTLWDISAKYLGSPLDWPFLWRYNNRRSVIAITGKKIQNPDLIYPGQKLLIPSTGNAIANVSRSPTLLNKPKQSLKSQLPNIKSPISFSYSLNDISQYITSPGIMIEIKLKGNIVLSTQNSYPINYVINNKQLETKVNSSANNAFSSLTSETKVAIDGNKVTVGSKIISKSSKPNVPSTAIGIQMSSNSPIPKIHYEIQLPELKGKINEFNYLADKVTFIIEVTRFEDKSAKDTEWPKTVAIGLTTAALVTVVGTLVEDAFTGSAGVIDDPFCFSVAAAMRMKAIRLWNLSDKALVPAVVKYSTIIVPAATVELSK
ncbi:LysM peptidoglycan-binding domain-containing protein [Psychromonas sp. PT13]|uniref:LysM peptidoglycan-binding domain-containing protein n=1 Tax=Psychromonas sp. PT13 TaxID=3439547 RepID=UPI003EBDEFD2